MTTEREIIKMENVHRIRYGDPETHQGVTHRQHTQAPEVFSINQDKLGCLGAPHKVTRARTTKTYPNLWGYIPLYLLNVSGNLFIYVVYLFHPKNPHPVSGSTFLCIL